ncbi:MAG: transposase [Clostridia bacterium]|nr:transposase [Clostridia bacterium]
MPRYKLSPEERAAEKERKENLRNIMKGLDVKNFDDLKDVFKMMVGEMLENGLDGELVDELGYTKYDYRNKEGENSRNGYSKKTLKTSFGETEIKVPRDRDGEFEPQLVKKNQTTLTGDIEEKIISMYAKGMTTSDIEAHIKDIYGLECSDTTISRITDKILPVVREWQSRPLEEIIPQSSQKYPKKLTVNFSITKWMAGSHIGTEQKTGSILSLHGQTATPSHMKSVQDLSGSIF